MKHSNDRIASIAAALLVAAGCSHGARTIEPDPAALARVHAEVRLVGSETTFVAHGESYELIGRTKADLAVVGPTLDAEAANFHRVFPGDTLAPVVVTVRRLTAPGKPYVGAAPVPNNIHGAVIEVVLPDPKAKPEDDKARGAAAGMPRGEGMFGPSTPALPVVRAWLSAHASSLTHKPAPSSEAYGETEDPRVPAWAQETIPMLGADSLVDRFTIALAAHPDNLFPISNFLTMARPPFVNQLAAGRSGERGASGGEGRSGGGAGGMGGMGGMGGGRGGMGGGRGGGRGGNRGGGGESSSTSHPAPALEGAMLFNAQAVVFGKYLVSRQGYDFIGSLVDAGINGSSIDEMLIKRSAPDLTQMDSDFRRWLMDRALVVNR